jgi:hypothetical protein
MQSIKIPEAITMDGTRGYDGLDELRVKAYQTAMQGKVRNLLSVGNDAKTVKGEPYGVLTGVLYMAPASVSGYEICPKRTKGCSAACLFTAGQGRFPNVKQGRLRRTYQWLFRRDEFLSTLVAEIVKYGKQAQEREMVLAIRLNGTSDIAYEDYPVTTPTGELVPHIFAAFPDIQFYDYTKMVARVDAVNKIPNYHMTFSRAETQANHSDARLAAYKGTNVTVVFRKELPATFMELPVIDGDRHDIRFQDVMKVNGSPVIIGLLAKGKAKKDTSGFVVD